MGIFKTLSDAFSFKTDVSLSLMKVLVTGATGFVGSALVPRLLAEGHEVRVVSRNTEKAKTHFQAVSKPGTRLKYFAWDPQHEVAPATALEEVDAVIHLAGENVASGRWDSDRKKRILESRQIGTRNLARGIQALKKKPVFISSSAIGFYGDRGDELLSETSRKGSGFLARVCEAWEAETAQAEAARLVIFRNGVVLGRKGGALAKMLPIFKAGIAGRIGSGKQWVSWIHLDDLLSAYLRAVTDKNFSGVYNLSAPEPVRNRELTETLASALHRPAALPVPVFALKLALGELAEETLLASQRIVPERLLRQPGFTFRYPSLAPALEDLVKA
jgi:uncharacterized protein (TIGR01777 family)